MFIDDDDVMPIDAIEKLYMANSEDVDIIAGRRLDLENVHDEKGDVVDNYCFSVFSGRDVCERISEDKQQTIITPLWGKLYKKDFLDKQDLYKYQSICPTIFLRIF